MTSSSLTSILVTGGAGFIGSNLIEHLLEKYPQYKIVNLDALTYAGNPDNLKAVQDNPRYTFVKGDICDKALLEKIFTEHDIRGVFHLAAESHVDNSIAGPEIFFMTNVIGTQRLIHTAYRHWMNGVGDVKKGYEGARFHLTSTDEVYGTLGETGLFSETTPYAPNPPYAASKAGGDFVVRSYNRTFGLNATISNCSNNYGPHQHAEKLIPTIIRKALAGQPIPIYGDGKNIRDWLYVKDHANALDTVFHNGRSGETYNIGCDNEQDNNAMAGLICGILDELKPQAESYSKLISYVKDRAGHDRRYAIDSTKIETELGWKAQSDFMPALRSTVQWFMENRRG
ncbi:MAG TPA: dTDP-glucose 4,6-dehydratase [Alphaproteobacteria bacterium]|nr:dTDP-glucose 4,6-dehydratase [Alphaproteobacteria bacterium]